MRRFVSWASWSALVTGLALGVPLGVALERYYTVAQRPPSFAWQLSLGVLLGGIVAWVIPEFIAQLRARWETTKPLCRMLSPLHTNSVPTVIFLASLYPKGVSIFEKPAPHELQKTMTVEPHYGTPWVLTEGDTLALGYLMSLLGKVGRTENISIVRDDSGLDFADVNVVCIGSPKSNIVARQLNDSFKGIPLRFSTEGGRQVLRADDASAMWRADTDYDYGVLVKARSDYNSMRSVFLIAGISYPGTAGAGYYLWHQWRSIAASVGDRPFGLVLRVRRDNYQYAEQVWVAPNERQR
jgi:hypothetical protein